jgi:predicted nucleic acid-binding protein
VTASFVVDCSITMSWCFGDEQTPASLKVRNRLENEAALVPAHWFLEVTNVLAMAEKHKRIKADDSVAFLDLLEVLDIQVDHESSQRAFAHLLPLCRAHGLTSYDAAYLDVALRRQLGLATLDEDLRAAAKKLGITVYGK